MASVARAISAIVVFDIDGVIRDVGGSYRRALADTVEQFTQSAYRPSQADIDALKEEGIWNNDWEASQELIYRYFEAQGQSRSQLNLTYDEIVAFFQSRYRGTDPNNPDLWTGYICQEPLLVSKTHLEDLTQAGIYWGFFSGATRGSASYILERRLGLEAPVLIAMEDAPGKPDPTGLFATVRLLEERAGTTTLAPVIYVGDTVADMQTVEKARSLAPDRSWIGVGVLPPHAQQASDYAVSYARHLEAAGATITLNTVVALNADRIAQLVQLA